MLESCGAGTTCESCKKEKDTQTHAVSCGAYADLRRGLDLSDDGDLVKFFRSKIVRRDEDE